MRFWGCVSCSHSTQSTLFGMLHMITVQKSHEFMVPKWLPCSCGENVMFQFLQDACMVYLASSFSFQESSSGNSFGFSTESNSSICVIPPPDKISPGLWCSTPQDDVNSSQVRERDVFSRCITMHIGRSLQSWHREERDKPPLPTHCLPDKDPTYPLSCNQVRMYQIIQTHAMLQANVQFSCYSSQGLTVVMENCGGRALCTPRNHFPQIRNPHFPK